MRFFIAQLCSWFSEVNAILRLCLASPAIRSCFVDTLSGFKAPSCFSTAVLLQRCSASLGRVRVSRVPRRPQYYQSTTTACLYYGITYLFALPLRTDVSAVSLPIGTDLRWDPVLYLPSQPVTFGQLPPSARRKLSQVPAESFPCLCPVHGSRPVRSVLTLTDPPVLSPSLEQRRHPCDTENFGTQSRGFSSCCLRFTCVSPRPVQGSLPVGG